MKKFSAEFVGSYIQCGNPGLFLVTSEQQRVERDFLMLLKGNPKLAKHKVFCWMMASGVVDLKDRKQVSEAADPLEVLNSFVSSEGQPFPAKAAVLLMEDLHLHLEGGVPNAILISAIKRTLRIAKSCNKTLVITGCRFMLPPELERELVMVDYSLPDAAMLGEVLDNVVKSANAALKAGGGSEIELEASVRESVVASASGMTVAEAENAFALSLVRHKSVLPSVIADEKAVAIRKSGVLELVNTQLSLSDVGGLETLKDWLKTRRRAMTKAAREFGLPASRGILLLGPPGTGKSLVAKATAVSFEVPLVKLDFGRLFGSLIGQTEQNLRNALNMVEAISPCVLWCDEIEKGLSGTKSGGASDGGVMDRVFGAFLTWLNEKTVDVFVVATANKAAELPPEFLRPGRFDALFFVDLPTAVEREAIWKIQLGKYGRKLKGLDLKELSANTAGFTGAEIEATLVDGLHLAFSAERDLRQDDLLESRKQISPVAKIMGDSLAQLRNWAKDRTRPAGLGFTEKPVHEMGERAITV